MGSCSEVKQMAHVLATPLQIYDELMNIAPDAEVTEVSSGVCSSSETGRTGSEINIKLPSLLEPLRLANAVLRKKFVAYIESCSIGLNDRIKVEDTQAFILENMSLSKWSKFRRVMYERAGRTCVDLIIQSLRDQASVRELRYLELASDQIDANPSKSELNYFREIVLRCKSLRNTERKLLLQSFESNYPGIFKRILDELTKKGLEWKSPTDLKYETFLRNLRSQVIGQDQVLKLMAAALSSPEVSKKDGNFVFLFAGPTGVGKTEIAKAIASTKNDRMIRFDMKMFSEEYHVSSFTGFPTGYLGSDDKSQFAKKIEEFDPKLISSNGSIKHYEIENLVLLFDELEEAHSRIKEYLSVLFDEGYIEMLYTSRTVEQGVLISKNCINKYTFKNTIMIATSNLFQDVLLDAMVAGESADRIGDIFTELNSQRLDSRSFTSEFIARMHFIPLGPF